MDPAPIRFLLSPGFIVVSLFGLCFLGLAIVFLRVALRYRRTGKL